MMSTILVLGLLNSMSCVLARLLHRGRLVPQARTDETGQNPRIWLIAGLKSQPKEAYQYIDFKKRRKTYLNFSYLGYHPKYAGRQLKKIVKGDDAICGVSIGAKTIEYADIEGDKVILINPCSCPGALNSHFYRMLYLLSLLLEVASFAVGWLSVLPFIPADIGTRTSLALVADQCYHCVHGTPNLSHTRYGIVVSTDDEMLKNEVLYERYPEAEFVEIKTMHGRIGSMKRGQAKLYEEAVQRLLCWKGDGMIVQENFIRNFII